MTRALSAAALLATLAIAIPVAAQGGPLGPPAGDDPCLPGAAQRVIAEFLDLTDDQIAAWDVLIAEREQAAGPLRDALAAVQQQLDELLGSPDPDPLAVGELTIERRDLGEQLAVVHRAYVAGFEGLLDAAQLAQYRFIQRAERAEPLCPAFRMLGLLPPHWR
jgi:Spy/CpxP family protein refolding chaperone